RLDPPQGYLAGGEIEFLGVDAAIDEDGVRLDAVEVLNVQALGLRDDLFKPWSWFARLGASRVRPSSDEPGALGGTLDGGGGLAIAPFRGAQAYALAAARAEANEDLDRGHDLGAGLRLGLAVQRTSPLSIELSGSVLAGVAGAETDRVLLDVGLQWSVGVDNGLRLGWQLDWRRIDGAPDTRDDAFDLRWLHYF
ncbi:MAG: hypothetical protein ACREUE_15610, partial [Panacagrimonas sp.]